ncbi:site-specific DNA-methyltransferase [Sediminimonas qiaohouensis]|uniref:site-specific DNA-methyltransferase n=1 Tax=Sediminimonas qiaohouensis TaxID=552061 RepID=UPI00041586D5|nr:DNA methyltransferase [Sediminimonas qiaohouensis]
MSARKPNQKPAEAPAIVPLPLDRLKPYARNARQHSDKQIDLIARSIREFGFNNPVLIDRDSAIVAGHGRYEAAKRLKLKTVPTVLLEHLTEAQVKAYRIADNRIAELSDWDDEVLRLEIVDLNDLDVAGDLDFEISLTGFNTPELDIIIDGNSGDAAENPSETVEESHGQAIPVARLGEVWMLGRHRLLCGNALDNAAYTKRMGDEPARMVFTDPPYNVPINGHVRMGETSGHRDFAMGVGEMTDGQFQDFLRGFIRESAAMVMDGGVCMICMDWRHVADLVFAGKAEGLSLLNLCVWNKTNGGMGSLYRSKHEMVCVFKKGDASHVNNVELGRHGRYRTNVWDYAGVNTFRKGRNADLLDHPTVKPTTLVADAVRDVSHRGDIVLDPFCGSGATLLAAEKSGRCARAIELDPLYVDVAIRRWQQQTGEQAVLAGSDETFADRELVVSPKDEEARHDDQ